MADRPTYTLAGVLRQAREHKHLSARELAVKVGIAHSNIVRLEHGNHSEPRPQVLAALARELDLHLADLYVLAGYAPPTTLPSFRPYLRSRYHELPIGAMRELEASFWALAKKYGFDPEEPDSGDNET